MSAEGARLEKQPNLSGKRTEVTSNYILMSVIFLLSRRKTISAVFIIISRKGKKGENLWKRSQNSFSR
jgi:hypothetical protein